MKRTIIAALLLASAVIALPTETGPSHRSEAAAVDSNECSGASVCVTLDLARLQGPARRRAQGFLGFPPPKEFDQRLLDALETRQWRASGPAMGDGEPYNRIRATAASTTLVISDFWLAKSRESGTPLYRRPWDDWPAFDQFVRDLVRRFKDEGRSPEYWDIWNEPSTVYTGGGTPENFLEVYRHAHDAIRAVDPAAKIVGPSIQPFVMSGGRFAPDLKSFADFVAARRLRFDAVSWHEAGESKGPAYVGDHVREMRKLLAGYRSLADAQVFVNEFGSPNHDRIPGWSVAWIAALERANVDQANRACWKDGCYTSLDGLLTADGKNPTAVYWVHRIYAQMGGNRIALTSSDPTVSGFATADATGLVILLGRHQRCKPSDQVGCQIRTEDSNPRSLIARVRLDGEAVAATARVTRVANSTAPMWHPSSRRANVAIRDGMALVSLDGVADGEAYELRLDYAR